MKRLEELRKAENLLKRVLEDKASLPTALDQWSSKKDSVDHNLLESVRWQLVYISNDEDIRSKEPAYETAQYEELRRLYDKIQEQIASIEKNEPPNAGEMPTQR